MASATSGKHHTGARRALAGSIVTTEAFISRKYTGGKDCLPARGDIIISVKRAEHRRESLIALRAAHTAHRVVNEIRFPHLPNAAPPDQRQVPEPIRPLGSFLFYGRTAERGCTRELLIAFFTLLAIQIFIFVAEFFWGH
jgi:hypothetical protein